MQDAHFYHDTILRWVMQGRLRSTEPIEYPTHSLHPLSSIVNPPPSPPPSPIPLSSPAARGRCPGSRPAGLRGGDRLRPGSDRAR